jgi:hypothetical protein
MIFVKYKPIWRQEKFMIMPDEKVINSGGHITVGFSQQGMDGYNIAKVEGTIDIAQYSDFQMEELTLEETLDILRQADPDAEITSEGEFIMPRFFSKENGS